VGNYISRLRQRYWRKEAIPGWILFLWFLGLSVRQVVSLAGDVDFLVSDVDWDAIGGVAGDVLFSTWFQIVSFLGGVIWLGAIGLRPLPGGPSGTLVARKIPKSEVRASPSVKSDNVRWEDWGDYVDGGMKVSNPLCPKDYTPLRERHGTKTEFPGDYSLGPFECLECKKTYKFDDPGKRIAEARDEAKTRLIGMRHRADAGIEEGG